MKITLILLLGLFIFPISGQAQESAAIVNNYVVLTRNIEQLTPIFKTAKALQKEDQGAFGIFEVIICGKTVNNLVIPNQINDYLEEAKLAHVKLAVCGFSLTKFRLKKEKIPAGITIVPNGLLYNFQLQKKGYYNISL